MSDRVETEQTNPEHLSFRKVASLGDLEPNGQFVFEVDGNMLLLVRVGDQFYCIDDVCTHDGGTLSDGEIEDRCIICPRHGAKFSLETGEALTMPATESTGSYPVKIIGHDIFVSVP